MQNKRIILKGVNLYCVFHTYAHCVRRLQIQWVIVHISLFPFFFIPLNFNKEKWQDLLSWKTRAKGLFFLVIIVWCIFLSNVISAAYFSIEFTIPRAQRCKNGSIVSLYFLSPFPVSFLSLLLWFLL